MDGTGEQREEFGRRREPNTISWGRQQSSCKGSNESTPCGSMGIFQLLMEIPPHPSLPQPSQLQDPTFQAGNVLLDAQFRLCSSSVISHTHTQGAAAPQGPKSHLPSKCCSLQVFFQVIPTAKTSKERMRTQQCPPCLGSALPVPPNTKLTTERGRE